MTVVKSLLRIAIAAAIIVLFLLLRGQDAPTIWGPVVAVAVVDFVFEFIGVSGFLTAVAYLILALVAFVQFGSGPWGLAGVFAFPVVHEILVGAIDFLHSPPPKASAGPAK